MNNTEAFKNTAHQGREPQSAKAYLRFLESKGTATRTLYLRSRFLDNFTPNLINVEQTRKDYANALSMTMETLSEEDTRYAIHTSREFFPFWMNDIKSIGQFERTYGFATEEPTWAPKVSSLDSLISQIDQHHFSAKERVSLINYNEKLNASGLRDSHIKKRSKLAKIILLCLRDAPNNHHTIYRTAVDIMLPLFKSKKIKQIYLDVAREFFHIWKNQSDGYSI